MKTAVEIALKKGYAVNPGKELTEKEARRITSSDTGTGSLEFTAVYRQAWEQG